MGSRGTVIVVGLVGSGLQMTPFPTPLPTTPSTYTLSPSASRRKQTSGYM